MQGKRIDFLKKILYFLATYSAYEEFLKLSSAEIIRFLKIPFSVLQGNSFFQFWRIYGRKS